jgi:hypothetical protein
MIDRQVVNTGAADGRRIGQDLQRYLAIRSVLDVLAPRDHRDNAGRGVELKQVEIQVSRGGRPGVLPTSLCDELSADLKRYRVGFTAAGPADGDESKFRKPSR